MHRTKVCLFLARLQLRKASSYHTPVNCYHPGESFQLFLLTAVIVTCASLLCVTSAKPVTVWNEIPATGGRFYVAELPSQLARLTEYRATALIPAASAVAVAPPAALGTAYYAAYFA